MRLAVAHVVLALVSSLPALTAQSFSTRHYDRVVPLSVDPAELAVVADEAELDGLLARHGLAGAARRAVPVGGLQRVSLPPGVAPLPLVEAFARDGAFASPVFRDDAGALLIATERILLRFRAGTPLASQRALLDGLAATAGVTVLDGPGWAHLDDAWKLAVSTRRGDEVLALANALADRDDVRFATPSFVAAGRGALLPTDPLFGDTWGLHNVGQAGGTPDEDMDAVEAWDIRTGDADILVAVLDVGVEQTHPDIGQVPGADFVGEASGGDAFNACDHHGTPVAGCISGLLDNGLGSTGVAPGCRVASARTFATDVSACNGSWATFFESTPEALAWAEDLGARVSNNSNFYGFTDAATEDAYAATRDNGMLHVASAGNFSVPFVEYPASLPTVLAVSASDRFGGLAWFSSWGAGLALSAPGLDIVTTDRTGAVGYDAGDYTVILGTSFSAPYTAGVAALVLSRNAYLSATDVEQILFDSAVDHGAAGYDDVFGWGVVNAHAALLITPAFVTSGLGLPGVGGIPFLAATGSLAPSTGGLVSVDFAAASALCALFMAPSSQPVSFKGGTLYPFPFLPPVFLTTDTQGRLALPYTWPSGLPGDLELWVQVGVSDQAAANGVSLSNALVGVTP